MGAESGDRVAVGAAELTDFAEVIYQVCEELHRLGWRRDHPRIVAWLNRAGFRSFSELDSKAYQALLYNLRSSATPENPTQAQQIAHLQWQTEKLTEVCWTLFATLWNADPQGRQNLVPTKELLEKMRAYLQTPKTSVPSVSSN